MSDKPTIVEALSAVMQEVTVVKKEDRNESQRFNFRGIDAVMNAVGPALRKHGVVVMPTVEDHFYEVATSSSGKPMGHVIVRVAYTFYGPAGDSLTCSAMGESMDVGDKAMPKAMSVAFRTALLQALTLPTDEIDPDAESYERGPAKKAPAKKAKPTGEVASPGQVSGLVDEFASVEATEDLTLLVQKVAGLNLSEADADILRSAYTAAKQRLEAT